MVKNVLVVDDEIGTLLAYKKLLQSPEVEIHTAATLQEATDYLGKNPYDVVISDLRLGGSIGFEGFEVMRFAKAQNPNTAIILITAYGNAEIKRRAALLGATLYFEKPILAADLRKAIATLGAHHEYSV
ncbi:MAG TPA: response regulator [Acidobacteriota bacterium]|nr:response regulator [Acidobacteriota bacterium]